NHQGGNLRVLPCGGADALDNEEGIVQRFGAEKDPGKRNEGEHTGLLQQPGHSLPVKCRALQLARDQHPESVQSAPDSEGPGSAVPDAGNEKGDEQIAISVQGPVASSPKRYIHIVAKPTP